MKNMLSKSLFFCDELQYIFTVFLLPGLIGKYVAWSQTCSCNFGLED